MRRGGDEGDRVGQCLPWRCSWLMKHVRLMELPAFTYSGPSSSGRASVGKETPQLVHWCRTYHGFCCFRPLLFTPRPVRRRFFLCSHFYLCLLMPLFFLLPGFNFVFSFLLFPPIPELRGFSVLPFYLRSLMLFFILLPGFDFFNFSKYNSVHVFLLHITLVH